MIQAGRIHRHADADERALLARQLGALAHPVRLEILDLLSGRQSCCCKDVVDCLPLAQSTVSQHLKVLVEAGIVRYAADRQRSRYEVDREAVARLTDALGGVLVRCCGTPPETCGGSR